MDPAPPAATATPGTATANRVRYVRGAALALIFGLGFLLFRPFLVTFTVAASVALLARPLQDRMAQRIPRSLAAALLLILVFLLLVLPVAVYATLVSKQVAMLAEWIRPRLDPARLQEITAEGLIGRLESWLGLRVIDREAVSAFLTGALTRLVDFTNRLAQDLLGGLASFLLQLVVFLFMLFFLLRDGDRLAAELRGISPFGAAREREITEHLVRTIKGIVAAQILVPIAQGLVALPGFYLLGLPSPLFWSALVVFGALIPLVGTPLVWVPASVYMMIQVSPGRGIATFLYGLLAISTIDNLIKPLVLGGAARIHPLLGFLAILGGLLSFGPAGVIVGPVILSLVISALRVYRMDVWGGPPSSPA